MKIPDECWIYLEPYVHILKKGTRGLLYNTVNRKYFVVDLAGPVNQLFTELGNPANAYVTRLAGEVASQKETRAFIRILRDNYMGDMVPVGRDPVKPFNTFPLPVIKKKKNINLKDHIRGITFHVNATSDPVLEPYRDAFYQFGFPMFAPAGKKKLDPGLVSHMITQLKPVKNLSVNFIGTRLDDMDYGAVFQEIVRNTPFKLTFILTSETDLRRFQGPIARSSHVALYVTQPISQAVLDTLTRLTDPSRKFKSTEVHFIVRDLAEVEVARMVAQQPGLKNIYFKPYFTGRNLSFFQEQVFIGEEDLNMSRPTQNQVFSRLIMNDNDFGKLIVLPDGAVHANVNDPAVGDLAEGNLENFIDHEMNTGQSWKRTRISVSPCSECLYQFLCPPVSNYELFMKRFNFCHIFP